MSFINLYVYIYIYIDIFFFVILTELFFKMEKKNYIQNTFS